MHRYVELDDDGMVRVIHTVGFRMEPIEGRRLVDVTAHQLEHPERWCFDCDPPRHKPRADLSTSAPIVDLDLETEARVVLFCEDASMDVRVAINGEESIMRSGDEFILRGPDPGTYQFRIRDSRVWSRSAHVSVDIRRNDDGG
jgi:hypothetical protein